MQTVDVTLTDSQTWYATGDPRCYYGSGAIPYQWPPSIPKLAPGYQRSLYTTRGRRKDNLRFCNPCTHFEAYYRYYPIQTYSYSMCQTSVRRYYPIISVHQQIIGHGMEHLGALHIDPDVLGKQAADHLYDRFSLLNVLLEMPELKDLAQFFMRVPGLLRGIASKISRGRRLSKSEELLRQGFLTHQFGLKPLVSDAKSVYSRLTAYDREFLALSRTLLHGFSAHRVVHNKSHTFEFLAKDKENLEYNCKFTGTLKKCCFGIVKGKIQSKAFNIRDRAGLRLDLGTIWNALPFSFVVDYFATIGEALSPAHPAIQDLWLERTGKSVKLEGQLFCYPLGRSDCVMSVKVKWYCRVPHDFGPLDGRNLRVSPPSPEQLLNIIAIARNFT